MIFNDEVGKMVSEIKSLATPLQDFILREAMTDRDYANKAATELLDLRAELATAKARAKTAEENWHKNEAKTGHMNNALTTCVMFLVNTNTITEEKQVELIKSLRMAGLVDLADSVSVGGFASVFEGVE